MIFWSALVLGLAGSLHCTVMCGPLVCALPGKDRFNFDAFLQKSIYHSGRILTYVLLGLVFGAFGWGLKLAGWQQVVSIGTGTTILLLYFIPKFTGKNLFPFLRLQNSVIGKFKRFWPTDRSQPHYSKHFVLGLLNGFLPCGLVYVALTAALAIGDLGQSALFMAVFGLGTAPALVLLVFFKNLALQKIPAGINRLIPVLVILLAAFFILRGMDLGIPYLSPELTDIANGSGEHSCH